ncbi:TIGR03084 family metal-binding protein [Williamsia deligens]|uniref:TIGR03084 family metal-binding protein n=1 Tax=Williamsia deligens TaxID=321325 RepID=A0ABW3G6U6_9NOCA|nr:TIGR03084 family metal-binding protein [Williamsia deligens]MCP2194657.1 TIGR03084 family protein [Williamsia deligens]
MTVLRDLVDDMTAEAASLDDLVAGLDDTQWLTPTPAEGWTVADQVGHLAWTDRVATVSATDPDGFAVVLAEGAADPANFIDDAAAQMAAQPPADLLRQWRDMRAALADALLATPAGTKLAWFGPPMSAASMATARIMEYWAHGQDVADALGVTVEPTDRLKAVAHIGARTRDFAYVLRGKTPPADEFRIELTGPSGDEWTWGPQDATDRVTGSAVDFCLLVTQRRAPEDLGLTVVGDDATEWTAIAQCFAGAPGPGRAPRVDAAVAR